MHRSGSKRLVTSALADAPQRGSVPSGNGRAHDPATSRLDPCIAIGISASSRRGDSRGATGRSPWRSSDRARQPDRSACSAPGSRGSPRSSACPRSTTPRGLPMRRALAFAARAGAGADLRIYVSAADGSGAVAVSAGPSDDEPAVGLSDGTEIAFTHHRADGSVGGRRRPGRGRAATLHLRRGWGRRRGRPGRLTARPGSPSPAACSSAIQPGRVGTPARPASTSSDADWRRATPARSSWARRSPGANPTWSPDGTRILVTIADATQVYGVVVVNASTGAITGGLIGGQAARRGPWSPDGAQIAVDQPSGPDPAARLGRRLRHRGSNVQALIAAVGGRRPGLGIGSGGASGGRPHDGPRRKEAGPTRCEGLLQVTAQQGIADVSCAVDGGHPQTIPHDIGDPFHLLASVMLFAGDGDHVLSRAP